MAQSWVAPSRIQRSMRRMSASASGRSGGMRFAPCARSMFTTRDSSGFPGMTSCRALRGGFSMRAGKCSSSRLLCPAAAVDRFNQATAVPWLWQLEVAQLGWMIAGEM